MMKSTAPALHSAYRRVLGERHARNTAEPIRAIDFLQGRVDTFERIASRRPAGAAPPWMRRFCQEEARLAEATRALALDVFRAADIDDPDERLAIALGNYAQALAWMRACSGGREASSHRVFPVVLVLGRN